MKIRFEAAVCLIIIGCVMISASGCPLRIRSTGSTGSPETSKGGDPTDNSAISEKPDPEEDTSDRISRIDVYHSSFGMTMSEYRIDLDGRSFSVFSPAMDGYDEYAPRDPDAENEGFTPVSELSAEAVSKFRAQCEILNLTDWKEEYYNNDICDGHQWGMTIRFADGSERQIFGSNEYPDTWDDMREAFEELTGSDVLQVSSDWLYG